MNRHEAKKLAETVTLEDFKQMFLNAQSQIKDWTMPCRVNKGMSLGAAFNILSKNVMDRTSIKETHPIAIKNCIWAFGEYLPGYEKTVKAERAAIVVHHEEPNLIKQP